MVQCLDGIDDKLALFVAQPWMLLSESNNGVAGVPKLLIVYSHPPLSHLRQQRVTRKGPGSHDGAYRRIEGALSVGLVFVME